MLDRRQRGPRAARCQQVAEKSEEFLPVRLLSVETRKARYGPFLHCLKRPILPESS